MSFEEMDICANNHGGNEYSVAAHDSIVEGKAAMWAHILAYLEENPSTCEEYMLANGKRTSTCSARFSELKKLNKIIQVSMRPTTTGRMAAVFAVNKEPVKVSAATTSDDWDGEWDD